MSYQHCLRISASLFVCFSLSVVAQQPSVVPTPVEQAAAKSSDGPALNVDNNFIHKQFGEEFTLISISTPFVRDVDGDGVDDFVIVAMSKKPLLDQAEHHYKVIDPYYGFYGYGDPKLTASFGTDDPRERSLVVLIIHGAGPEAWRAENPKAKFVIINLPLKRISVKRLQLRKKQVNAIYAVEADASAGDSVVFWDGKQYKYQPIGTGGGD
jgi:hypothetical protein